MYILMKIINKAIILHYILPRINLNVYLKVETEFDVKTDFFFFCYSYNFIIFVILLSIF